MWVKSVLQSSSTFLIKDKKETENNANILFPRMKHFGQIK